MKHEAKLNIPIQIVHFEQLMAIKYTLPLGGYGDQEMILQEWKGQCEPYKHNGP